jgi:glycosyltransferase involved in cell wall biosynthesis
MLVSVIITTKNEEKNIARCLRSIADQAYPKEKLEIVVVDNYSTDKTRKIAENFSPLSVKIFNKGPERSAQRNFGARNSRGFFFLFLDADMSLSGKVIKECVEKAKRDKNLAGLFVPEKIRGGGFWGSVRNLERSCYDGTAIDAVRFVRRDVFFEVGGFDESLTGPEDWDFDKRVREQGRVALVQAPLYHNEVEFKIKKYLEKKKYYSRDFEKYIRKWGRNDPDIRKQFGFCYRYAGVFTENGKWKRLIRRPFLALGVYFLRILVGAGYFSGKYF